MFCIHVATFRFYIPLFAVSSPPIPSNGMAQGLAQARLQKSRGQPTAFLSPLLELLAIDRSKADKRQHANQRSHAQRAKGLTGEPRDELGHALGIVRQDNR